MLDNISLTLENLNNFSDCLVIAKSSGKITFKNTKALTILPSHENILDVLKISSEILKSELQQQCHSDLNTMHPHDGKPVKINWKIVNLKNKQILFLGKIQNLYSDGNGINHERIRDHIINNLPEAIFWKGKDLRFLGCNTQFANAAGYANPEQIIGKTDYELPWKKLAAQYLEDDRQVIYEKKEKLSYEEINKQADDSEKTVLVSKVPLKNESNEVVGVLGMFRDISALKELDRRKKQNEIDKEVIDKLELMAISLAHELRTPIAGIRSGLIGIKKYLPILVDAYQSLRKASDIKPLPIRKGHLNSLSNILERLIKQTQSCDRIIDIQLRNISFKSIDKDSLSLCSINEVLQKALDTYPFEKEEVPLINYDNSRAFEFLGNVDLSIHIFWNLLKNALYYIHHVNHGEIYIWFDSDEIHNKVYFKDTAQGVSREIKDKIFDKFYTERLYGTGTGVGLSFSKMVMEAYGGSIDCNSEWGKHAEFILNFPKII